MENEIKKETGMLNEKNKMVEVLDDLLISPLSIEENPCEEGYKSLPLENVASLGIAFEPVMDLFQNLINGGESVSDIYRVTIPKGGKLAQFKDGSGYMGAVLIPKPNGSVGLAQARLNPIEKLPVSIDPVKLFMAVALSNIENKLDDVLELQQEILNFLIEKERSELMGDLKFLDEVYSNYKLNWDNEKYKTITHIKVLDIKQDSVRKIDFIRKQIKRKMGKKKIIHIDRDVKKQLEQVELDFKDYQIALYLYAYSSFLEVMLLENYEKDYLDSIIQKMENYNHQYRFLYGSCYEKLEGATQTSVQAHFLKGLSGANKIVGETIAKVPIVSKGTLDEQLIESAEKLGDYGQKRTETTLKSFIKKQNAYIKPFIENIQTINNLYNQPFEILIDRKNLYLVA